MHMHSSTWLPPTIAPPLPVVHRPPRQESDRVFDAMDSGGEGHVGVDELYAGLRRLGFDVSVDEAESALSTFDLDETGSLTRVLLPSRWQSMACGTGLVHMILPWPCRGSAPLWPTSTLFTLPLPARLPRVRRMSSLTSRCGYSDATSRVTSSIIWGSRRYHIRALSDLKLLCLVLTSARFSRGRAAAPSHGRRTHTQPLAPPKPFAP